MNIAEQFQAACDRSQNATDVEMRQWMSAHRKEYDEFRLKMISGDMDVMEKMLKFYQQCLPREAKEYFKRLDLWMTDKMKLEDRTGR